MSKKRDRRAASKHKKKEQQGRERANTMAVKTDMQQPSDPGVGTSPSSMGAVKMASEEARLITCPDCGFSKGRHSRLCPRA